MSDLYRQLPRVDAVVASDGVCDLPHDVAVACVRAVLDEVRSGIARGELDAVPDVREATLRRAQVLVSGKLRRVINASGVVLHTNLGRAPWAPEAVAAVAAVAAGYCDLELDLATGERGGRLRGPQALLAHLTGAEAALVVNNNAAAVLLALTSLAKGSEVIVSRGELVEIGGSFRVPDVIASGGAELVEVGTTNRTRLRDYAAAIGERTALLLKVHRSNFAVVGFTEETSRAELAALGRRRGLPVVEDLGSGCLEPIAGEPSVREVVASGIDLVTFSGDKLLGGPQAGVVVGRRDLVAKLRKHPMYRALRVCKTTLAALEATLVLHARGLLTPTTAMIRATEEELGAAADTLQRLLTARGVPCRVRRAQGRVGGGALPTESLSSPVVAVEAEGLTSVVSALRQGEPAVVARVADGAILFDPRTVRPTELEELADRVAAVIIRG